MDAATIVILILIAIVVIAIAIKFAFSGFTSNKPASPRTPEKPVSKDDD